MQYLHASSDKRAAEAGYWNNQRTSWSSWKIEQKNKFISLPPKKIFQKSWNPWIGLQKVMENAYFEKKKNLQRFYLFPHHVGEKSPSNRIIILWLHGCFSRRDRRLAPGLRHGLQGAQAMPQCPCLLEEVVGEKGMNRVWFFVFFFFQFYRLFTQWLSVYVEIKCWHKNAHNMLSDELCDTTEGCSV